MEADYQTSQGSIVSYSLQPHGLSLRSYSLHGVFQARILEWVAMPSSRGSSQARDQTHVSYIDRQIFFTTSATWEAH